MWYQIFGNGYSLLPDVTKKHVMYRIHAKQTSKTRRDLLVNDSYQLSKIILPMFIRCNNHQNRILYKFAKQQAKHDCCAALHECIKKGKEAKILRLYDVVYLYVWQIIGKVRNCVKKIYYRFRL